MFNQVISIIGVPFFPPDKEPLEMIKVQQETIDKLEQNLAKLSNSYWTKRYNCTYILITVSPYELRVGSSKKKQGSDERISTDSEDRSSE